MNFNDLSLLLSRDCTSQSPRSGSTFAANLQAVQAFLEAQDAVVLYAHSDTVLSIKHHRQLNYTPVQ